MTHLVKQVEYDSNPLGCLPKTLVKGSRMTPSMPHREQMFANGAADGEKKILQGMVKPEIMCYNRSITRSGSLCSACGGAGGENKEACEG